MNDLCRTRKERTKKITVLKSVGPRLVPFFKTLAIYFVLFSDRGSCHESLFHALIKCLPIASLIIFVLLHGLSFSEYYSYSRKVLIGLILSGVGDAFLVWQSSGYFLHGLLMFAGAQLMYASAFGLRPTRPWIGVLMSVIGVAFYAHIYGSLNGAAMTVFTAVYVFLICFMTWRALARVHIFNDLWTWTKLCGSAGAVFFCVSDFVVATQKFVTPVPYAHIIIMVTYYAAQLGITLSVVDSQVDAFFENGSTVDGNVDSNVDSYVDSNVGGNVDSDADCKVDSNVDCYVDSNVDRYADSDVDALSENGTTVDSQIDSHVDSHMDNQDGSVVDRELTQTGPVIVDRQIINARSLGMATR